MNDGNSPAFVEWASQWRTYADEVHKVFSDAYDAHVALGERGAGKLAGIRKVKDICFDPTEDWADAGVVVLSERWLQNPVYVVGDLHGDIVTLEEILNQVGFSVEQDNPVHLLFLGDYGDRGDGTLAVWSMACWLKVQCPERVMLLRGNHDYALPCVCSTTPEAPFQEKRELWFMPFKQYRESYAALAFALQGSIENMGEFLRVLPACAVLPDGRMFVHGGVLPGFGHDSGWVGAASERKALRVRGVCDLRKPHVQFLMTWVDMLDKPEDYMVWSGYPKSRIGCSNAGFRSFQKRTGVTGIVCGHQHPVEGFRLPPAYRGDVLVLNSGRETFVAACDPVACYGHLLPYEGKGIGVDVKSVSPRKSSEEGSAVEGVAHAAEGVGT